jgi:hypothetical protein
VGSRYYLVQLSSALHLDVFRGRSYTTKVVFLLGKKSDSFHVSCSEDRSAASKSDRCNKDIAVCVPTGGPAEEMGVQQRIVKVLHSQVYAGTTGSPHLTYVLVSYDGLEQVSRENQDTDRSGRQRESPAFHRASSMLRTSPAIL